MPDGSAGPQLSALHVSAVAEVEAWLQASSSGVRRLSAAELRRCSARAPVAGWLVPVQASVGGIELHVIVDKEFPWAAPRIAYVGDPQFGRWPHAECDNVLCIDSVGLNPLDPTGVLVSVLSDAVALVEQSISDANCDDFLSEFETYWTQLASASAPAFTLLMRPGGTTRLVRLWRDARHTIVADDDEEIETWVKNAGIIDAVARIKSSPALVASVKAPPLPDAYPRSGAALAEYLRREAPEALAMLERLADPQSASLNIIMMSQNAEGSPVAAAMVLLRPSHQTRGPGRTPLDTITRGFRHAIPSGVALLRYLGGAYRTARVERADRDWIHGRDADPASRMLAKASVIVVGGGSIGAPVALSLAHAGVGEISVVDNEALEFGNIGRHPLGARSVGKNKALELVAEMKRQLPHLKGNGYSLRFQEFRDEHHDLLANADLIVSAMGDWPAEGALNAWRLAQVRRPPIVFGWAEEHACAGHAVAIVEDGSCFACGMSPNGKPHLRLTQWPGPMLVKQPGCGAHFQPYGIIEIGRIADTVAEAAIAVLLGKIASSTHMIWAASEAMLTNAGGAWTPEWLEACGGRGEGGFLFSRQWGEDTCWQCGVRAK